MLGFVKRTKLYSLWNSLNIGVKASVAIMIANFYQPAINTVLYIIITRLLTTKELGIVTVYDSIQSMVAILAMMSLHTTVYNRGMQEFKDDRDSFTVSLLLLSNISTLLVGILVSAFFVNINDRVGIPIVLWLVMFATFLFQPAYNMWIARQKFEYKYKGMLIISIMSNTISPIMAIVLICSPMKDKSAAKVIGAEVSLIVVYIIIYAYLLIINKGGIKRKYILYGVRFNLPLIPHYASQQVLASCDQVMIKMMVSTSSAGIYGLAYKASSVVRIVWTSINAALIPWEYEKIEQGKRKEIKELTRNLIIIYAVVCIVIMLVAPEVVKIFAPQKYYDGIMVMAPIIGGVFFSGLYSLLAILEFYYKKTIYVMVASTIAAVLNVILNWIFIPLYGYQAAAYTTLACYFLYAMLHAINLYRLKLTYFYDMKIIYILSGIVLAISMIVTRLYSGYIVRYAFVAMILILGVIKREYILDNIRKLRSKD